MRIGGKVETQDAHIPSSMRRVYYRSRGRVVTIRVTGGWASSNWWNHGSCYVKLLKEFQDIRFLLDQRSEVSILHIDVIDVLTTYRTSMFEASIRSPIILTSVYGKQYSYTPTPMVSQTPRGSLFYQSGSSLQPLVPRTKDTMETKEN
ncbi:hypothetical protein J1N35_035014 [Gossypium stocksii]|uniref:Uncharacterized protein n=1 Tax=Gossypium stocksii TaxID=47602 RepID=A0A9D3ZQJ8_9ROSI|nr:hypothetical protein J1N35_035014 [Gossypium stocksii]